MYSKLNKHDLRFTRGEEALTGKASCTPYPKKRNTMSHWFEYFPENHMWSQGMMFGIEMAAWGAASLSEIDQIGQKLRGHVGDNERWWTEWNAMAKRIEGFGDKEEALGHRLTSGAYYLRAAIYYFCGERFLPPSERKWQTYRD